MDNITGIALVDFANPKYRSNVEAQWSTKSWHLLADYFGMQILRQDYEPFTFHLPGGIKYSPDFLHIVSNGKIVFAEIKNSRKNKGYRVTLNKLKTAAEIYPYFIYIEVIKDKGWEIKRIGQIN